MSICFAVESLYITWFWWGFHRPLKIWFFGLCMRLCLSLHGMNLNTECSACHSGHLCLQFSDRHPTFEGRVRRCADSQPGSLAVKTHCLFFCLKHLKRWEKENSLRTFQCSVDMCTVIFRNILDMMSLCFFVQCFFFDLFFWFTTIGYSLKSVLLTILRCESLEVGLLTFFSHKICWRVIPLMEEI